MPQTAEARGLEAMAAMVHQSVAKYTDRDVEDIKLDTPLNKLIDLSGPNHLHHFCDFLERDIERALGVSLGDVYDFKVTMTVGELADTAYEQLFGRVAGGVAEFLGTNASDVTSGMVLEGVDLVGLLEHLRLALLFDMNHLLIQTFIDAGEEEPPTVDLLFIVLTVALFDTAPTEESA